MQAARQAQRAFNFERGHTTRRFHPRVRLGQPARGADRRGAAVRGAAPHGKGLSRRERPRIRADQAHLAAAAFPHGVPGLQHDGSLRDRDPGMDVRPRFPRAVHAPDQERGADDPVRHRPLHRRPLPPDAAQQHDAHRPQLQAPAHGCCCRAEPCDAAAAMRGSLARDYALCPTIPAPSGTTARAKPSPPRAARTIPACSSSVSAIERYLPFEFKGRSAAGASSCRPRTTTSTWTR